VFWALDKELANARFYPSINHLQSHSAYAGTVAGWWEASWPDWSELRQWLVTLLQEDASLQRIVKLLGDEALPEDRKLTLYLADLAKTFFLQQNAFDPVDMYAAPQRQVAMARALHALGDWWRRCFEEKGIPVKVLRGRDCVQELLQARTGVANDDTAWFGAWEERMRADYASLLATYGEVS